MRRASLLALGALVWSGTASARPPEPAAVTPHLPIWPVELQSDVIKAQKRFKGEFALYVKDLSTGQKYTYNASTPMYLASGIKIPVMVALFREVNAGRVKLTDEIVFEREHVRDGAPLLNYLRVGTPVTLKILLDAMIQQSDNAATDLVIGHVGVDTVNQVLEDEGIPGFGPITTLIDVRRLVYRHLDPRTAGFSPRDIFKLRSTKPLDARLDMLAEMLDERPGYFKVADLDRAYRAYYAMAYNSASVESMGYLLERIVSGRVVSKAHSQRMVEVMLGTQTGRRRIRAGLDEDVLLAHKTGTQWRRTCDFGVFYMSPERPVVFAIAVKGGSRRAAEGVMARIARQAYWHLATPEQRRRSKGLARRPTDEALDDGGEEDPTPKKKKKRRRRSRRVPDTFDEEGL